SAPARAVARRAAAIRRGDRATTAAATATGASTACVRSRRSRGILVRDALHVLAAIALELRFDPIDGVAIALRPLAPIAKLREPRDRRFVLLQVEALDERANRIVGRVGTTALRVRRSGRQNEEAAARGESC